MIAYFVSPYEHFEARGKPQRRLEFDIATEQIEKADGFWSESEVDGDRAIVRCRAPESVIADLETSFQRVEVPEIYWTSTKRLAKNHNGETIFTQKREKTRTLEELEFEVHDDKEYAELKKFAESLMRQADQQGYVRLRKKWNYAPRILCMVARHGYTLDQISTGTFPTTGLLDDFNRASIGSNWTTWTTVALAISGSTVLVASATNGEGYWNVATYGINSEVYFDITAKPPTNQFIATHLRVVNPGASNDSYEVNFKTVSGASNDTQAIAEYTSGTGVQNGATNTLEFNAGDSLGFEAIAGVLTCYRKASGSWSAAFSRTDSTPKLTTGYLSVYEQSTTSQLDNFSGGTVKQSLVAYNRVARNVLLRR